MHHGIGGHGEAPVQGNYRNLRGRVDFVVNVGSGVGPAPETMFRGENSGDVYPKSVEGVYQMGFSHGGGVVGEDGHPFSLKQGQVFLCLHGSGFGMFLLGRFCLTGKECAQNKHERDG